MPRDLSELMPPSSSLPQAPRVSGEPCRLILASASPRRKLLLIAAGYEIEIDPSDAVEHDPSIDEPVESYVALLAWRKTSAVATRRTSGLVLGADTACAIDGEILNKPIDRADAERMIRLQEGREIDIWTGLCLRRAGAGEWVGAVERSVCYFKPMTDEQRTAYLDSREWEGKAGGYGLQDDDPVVQITSGSWSNVVGLPLERLAELLRAYPRLWRDV